MTTVGQMDRLITIRRWSSITDSTGGLQLVESSNWQLWAKAENKKGSVLTANGQMTWSYSYTFTCYYEPDRIIRNQDTVDYDGQRIRINGLSIESEGNREMLVITCSTTGVAIIDNLSTMINIANYTGIGDETDIVLPELIGKVLKLTCKDGVEYRFITSGALEPGQKQVLFNDVTGGLSWSAPFYAGENAFIQYADV